MMPFTEQSKLQRRDSWPPTIVRIRDEDEEAAAEEASAIDENPFSFFLTSPEDYDDDDLEDLSAGIESSNSKTPQIREISPSAIQSSRLLPLADAGDEEVEYGFAMPLSLKDFTLCHNEGRKSRQETRTEDALAGLGIAIPESTASRGRAMVRLTPSRSGRGRGQTRTRSLSARRPHSWQVPSPDIGTIKEERESGDGEDQQSTQALTVSVSAPPSSEKTTKKVVKPKKRVHWAF